MLSNHLNNNHETKVKIIIHMTISANQDAFFNNLYAISLKTASHSAVNQRHNANSHRGHTTSLHSWKYIQLISLHY